MNELAPSCGKTRLNCEVVSPGVLKFDSGYGAAYYHVGTGRWFNSVPTEPQLLAAQRSYAFTCNERRRFENALARRRAAFKAAKLARRANRG